MKGRAEVGLPLVLATTTVMLAVVTALRGPTQVVLVDPFDAPPVSVPAWAIGVAAVMLSGCGVLLARRWARLTRRRQPARVLVGAAHALSWGGLALLVWLLVFGAPSWAFATLGIWPFVLGQVTGYLTTRHRPTTSSQPAPPPVSPGEAVTWTGHTRLGVDAAAPLLVFLLLVAGPSIVTTPFQPGVGVLGLVAGLLFILLVYNSQLRALWVTVTIGPNGIRIRVGPFGRVIHRDWDQIGSVEVLDDEPLSDDHLLWARRFARRYVLRPGPALRLHTPDHHLPFVTVSIDNADQAATIAAGFLAARHHST